MQKKEKQIQISEHTFVTAYKLILQLDNIVLDTNTRQLQIMLKKAFKDKLKAMEKRKIFTEYKTAPPQSIEREKNRKQYIKSAEVGIDWQTEKETYL